MNNKPVIIYLVFYFCLMEYMEMDCRVSPGGDHTEILIAYLAAIGYTMFEETDYGVKAYIPASLFSQNQLDNIPVLNNTGSFKVDYTLRRPEVKNWNEEWEKNFQPVIIGNDIYVRADYHPSQPNFRFELVIHPRMAFGTGHHDTTILMMKQLLNLPVKGKKVLDMGCGTAILAILAAKLGASELLAVDNDENATENAVVNCHANGEGRIEVLTGDAITPGVRQFDIILANINRNIILDDLHYYVRNLLPGGNLLLSGFFTEDLPLILAKAKENQLLLTGQAQQNNWCCAIFVKAIA